MTRAVTTDKFRQMINQSAEVKVKSTHVAGKVTHLHPWKDCFFGYMSWSVNSNIPLLCLLQLPLVLYPVDTCEYARMKTISMSQSHKIWNQRQHKDKIIHRLFAAKETFISSVPFSIPSSPHFPHFLRILSHSGLNLHLLALIFCLFSAHGIIDSKVCWETVRLYKIIIVGNLAKKIRK